MSVSVWQTVDGGIVRQNQNRKSVMTHGNPTTIKQQWQMPRDVNNNGVSTSTIVFSRLLLSHVRSAHYGNSCHPDCLSVCVSVTLWHNINNNRCMTMWFSSNCSTKVLVFCNVKMLLKFEGYHPQRNNFLQVPSFSLCKKMYTFAAVELRQQHDKLVPKLL